MTNASVSIFGALSPGSDKGSRGVPLPVRRMYDNWVIRGLLRFVGIVLGRKSETSQEAVANGLLVLGLAIEGYLLWNAVMVRANRDFDLSGVAEAVPIMMFLAGVVIFSLLF